MKVITRIPAAWAGALAALALAAPESAAKPARYPVEGSRAGDTLVLDPDSLHAYPWDADGTTYEYSGDYVRKREPFRILAQESYHARIGAFEGVAREHYLERREDVSDFPWLQEADFTAVLVGPAGDTVELRCGSQLTVDWKAGTGCAESYREKGADVPGEYVTVRIIAVDPDMRQDFPLKDGHAPADGQGVTSVRSRPGRLAFDPRAEGLRLVPPEGSRAVEIYGLDGIRLYAAPLLPGHPVDLPHALGTAGLLYVRWL